MSQVVHLLTPTPVGFNVAGSFVMVPQMDSQIGPLCQKVHTVKAGLWLRMGNPVGYFPKRNRELSAVLI